MISISGRSFNSDETNRYAGSRTDPSRMVANYAGVMNATDNRNDIIVRGNSPLGVLWRLEDIDIPNPNAVPKNAPMDVPAICLICTSYFSCCKYLNDPK